MVDWERIQLIIADQPTVDEKPAEVHADQRYQAVLVQLQQGLFEDALPMLQALQTDYPTAQDLSEWLNEVQIRLAVKQTWDGKIQGRRPQFLSKRLLIYLLCLPTVIVLLVVGLAFYQTVRVNAKQTQQIQRLLQQAQAALAHGDDRTAANFFRQALTLDRNQAVAQEGYRTAIGHLQVELEYQTGKQALHRKDFATAYLIFSQIERESPSYRDVERLLAQIPTSQKSEVTANQ